MKSNSFKYLVGEGAKNVWYNRLMSFASVGVLTTCLLLVGFAMLFTMNVDAMVEFVMQQNEAVVFVRDGATDEQTAALRQDLEANGNISSVSFVSKEEAFQKQCEAVGDPSLMEGLENEFPASFNVKITDQSRLAQTVTEMEGMDNVQKVSASPELAKTLSSVKNVVNIIGAVIIGALMIVSIVIIANTIRASVFSRRREINIMKYVGATDGFIRLPFVVEGLLLGILSALVAFLAIWGAYAGVVHLITGGSSSLWLKMMFQNIIPFREVAWQLGLAFAGAGMLTGGIGSAFCISSHLKV